MFRAVATVVFTPRVKVSVLELMVSVPKVVEELPPIVLLVGVPSAFRVTVPELCVKVPLFDQSPPMVKELLACAVKIESELIVTFPFTSKVVELVLAVTIRFVPAPVTPITKFPVTKVPRALYEDTSASKLAVTVLAPLLTSRLL